AVSLFFLYLYDISHDHLTVEKAMAPLHYLTDARHHIINSEYNSSIRSLESAIRAMKIIEHHADSTADAHIEQAIEDLKLVEAEIKNDSVVVSDLNRAFFNALNSIAFANITISEASIEKGEKYRALNYMNASFSEMIGSLKFATDEEQRKLENKVINEIRQILSKMKDSDHAYRFNYNALNQEFEELIDIEKKTETEKVN
ncbi:MAG: hypothetical protein AAF487_15340, partial [Bacteroidota bacterium]